MNVKPLPDCWGIIPARFASSRFPGKPLVPILGKPMFWHVYQRAILCAELTKVVLATDHEEIYASAEKLEVPVVMTRADHPSGTDRVLEAAQAFNLSPETVVVNIQGDEPTIDPKTISELVRPFVDPKVQVTTPIVKITPLQAKDTDWVKVVVAKNRQALYFSRAPIPYLCNKEQSAPIYGHIGLYAFRMGVLERFVADGPSILETAERLEPLRLLENNIPVHVFETEYQGLGVDRPEHIEMVRQILKQEKTRK
jgi:3-deoxy-manno-octulosonate cytidylyltransferase (CMP-KDO synthetase)